MSIVKSCWEIARTAGLPIVLENVREAQRWLGKAKAHYGSRYLWGDVPAMLPYARTGGDKLATTGEGFERQKQTMSSTHRAERAMVPIELARWIARCFTPPVV